MSKTIEFHFKGGSADNQQLPVDLMINLLSNIKELTYLIVAKHQGITFNERFKPSKKIKDNYVIKCDIPKEGSYEQTISIDYEGSEFDSLQENPIDDITKTLQYVVDNDEENLIYLYPNSKMRLRALSCVKNALPKSDSEIYTNIISENTLNINSKTLQKNITSVLDKAQAVVEECMTVVTGRLASIDFDEKKIIIIYPITRKYLDCFYNEDIEDMLFNNRRQLVQIVGKVVLDDNDNPKKITDVIDIQEIDLSPIELNDIPYNNKKLHFKDHLILKPELDETEQLYIINYPELGIESFAYTRQEITNDIKADIIYLWEEYAKASVSDLTSDALDLKHKLLEIIEEVDNV